MGKIYQQLTLADRTMIQVQLEMGVKPSVIASVLNRSASTISRELRRNNWVRPKLPRGPGRPPIAGGYRAEGFLLIETFRKLFIPQNYGHLDLIGVAFPICQGQ
jgi:hypothetical protein